MCEQTSNQNEQAGGQARQPRTKYEPTPDNLCTYCIKQADGNDGLCWACRERKALEAGESAAQRRKRIEGGNANGGGAA